MMMVPRKNIHKYLAKSSAAGALSFGSVRRDVIILQLDLHPRVCTRCRRIRRSRRRQRLTFLNCFLILSFNILFLFIYHFVLRMVNRW